MRTHRQEVEAAKYDGYTCGVAEVDRTQFEDAYEEARSIDGGIPEELPTDPEKLVWALKRSVLSLARRVRDLEYHWS